MAERTISKIEPNDQLLKGEYCRPGHCSSALIHLVGTTAELCVWGTFYVTWSEGRGWKTSAVNAWSKGISKRCSTFLGSSMQMQQCFFKAYRESLLTSECASVLINLTGRIISNFNLRLQPHSSLWCFTGSHQCYQLSPQSDSTSSYFSIRGRFKHRLWSDGGKTDHAWIPWLLHTPEWHSCMWPVLNPAHVWFYVWQRATGTTCLHGWGRNSCKKTN